MDRPITDRASARGFCAVVIGGSMAGMWAARVLSDHFEQVIVLERDRLPAQPGPRNAVPQARHTHVLLTQGQRILDRLFPGLDEDLAADGAPEIYWSQEASAFGRAGWSPHFESDLRSRTCSRDLLEWRLRQRLAAMPGVRFEQETTVTGLLAAGGSVSGVRVQRRGDHSETDETLAADFVVDASGRNSHAAAWLQELGYPAPQQTVVNAFLGYASRVYRRPAGFDAGWKSLLIASQHPRFPYGGVIYPIENEAWIVTLGGVNRHYPPIDEQGFLAFARQLAVPDLYQAIRQAQPLSPISGYRRTENILRHFDRLDAWPGRFVALGDAVCGFNPVYGQGMTVAALGALTLDDELRRSRGDLNNVGRRFQGRLAKVIRAPWLMATGEDLRWPATEGDRPSGAARLTQRYIDQVLLAAGADPVVSLAFWQVTHLVEPPTLLFHPRVVAHTLAFVARSALVGKGRE